MYFLVAKTIGHHFWHGLMAKAEIKHGRKTKNNFPLAPLEK
jgi:hypothetical protein